MKIRKISKISLLLLVVLIGVGYAAITTVLSINSSVKMAADSSNFSSNITFASAKITGTGAVANISADGKKITFTTADLTNVGDTSVLTYTIKNESYYGATVAVPTCTSTDDDFATYLTKTYSRKADLTLEKNATSNEETITIALAKSYPETTSKTITYTCTLSATANAA